jgi:hypothetical protein
METKPILQIVSGFKPNIDGMGDFARLLGDALVRQANLRSHFLIYRTPKTTFDPAEILPNTITYSAEPSPSAFLAEVARLRSEHDFDCALVHYGPYGYSRTGEPAAFVQAIEELAQQMRVLVFFHELYSSGMPWKRAFWTHRQQKACVAQMLRLASFAFTSNAKYIKRLDALHQARKPVGKIPIFSNVGEPQNLRRLADRSRQLVIFGQLATRIRLYRDHLPALENACRKLRIDNVVDVGSGKSPHIPASLAGAPLRSTGFMDEQPLSELMADSIAGVVGYWPDVWEKSGVMASYQAHALLPILVELEPRHIPKPPYLPYIKAEEISSYSDAGGHVSDASLQQIADAAHDHYMRHQSVVRCAEAIAAATKQS